MGEYTGQFLENCLRKRKELDDEGLRARLKNANSELVQSGRLKRRYGINHNYISLENGSGVKIRSGGQGLSGLVEIAIMADLFNPQIDCTPYVVVTGLVGEGREGIAYVAEHFGKADENLKNISLEFKLGFWFQSNESLRKAVEWIMSNGYTPHEADGQRLFGVDRPIATEPKDVEIKGVYLRGDEKVYLVDLEPAIFTNEPTITSGALRGKGSFARLASYKERLLSPEYSMVLPNPVL